MNKVKNFIMIILIIIFTIAVVPKEFQNDTFFTIAIGENILKNGIDNQEKLVWHDGLEFTNSRWIFDVLITLIYNIFDFLGIYIFVILMAIVQMLLYYFILNQITKNRILSFIATIITTYFISNEFVARAQIVSFIIFLLEFYCLEKLTQKNKPIYIVCLIIFPIILANIHSSVFPTYFAIYLPYIAEFVLSKFKLKSEENSKIIIDKRRVKSLLILFVLSIFLGFCTPATFAAYTDMFKAMNGISSDIIAELQPLNIFDSIYFTILVIITIAIIGFTKTKVKLTDCLYILGFGLMSLSTYRCIFFFYLISSICVFRIVNTFLECYEIKIHFNKYAKTILGIVIGLLIFIISLKNISLTLSSEYVNRTEYPVDISNYILENLNTEDMRIYNHFNCGSYLEFRGIKAFIDSRSGIFTPEFNEGCTVLEDWYAVENGQVNYKKIFEEYGITHVLVRKGSIIDNYIGYDNKWNVIYDIGTFMLYEKVN